MKNLKSIRIITIVLIAITTTIIVWMTNTPGYPGLCRWNPTYLTATKAFWLFDIINIILFSLSFLLHSKKAKSVISKIAIILVSLYAIIFIVLFIFLVYPGFTTAAPEYQLNEMTQETIFRTHSKGPLLRFAVSSDPHFGAGTNDIEATINILKTVKTEDYDAFFCLGDISEMGIVEDNYKLATKTFKDYLGDIPILTVFGNHDSLVNGNARFSKYFQTKQDRHYFRIDKGNLHIIVLNLLWDSKDFNKTQKNWLIQQLDSIPKDDMVITLHHAYGYCSGYKDRNTEMLWYDIPDMITNVDTLLEDYNVELDIAGHNHLLEYLKNKNTSYSIVGQMGGLQDLNKDYTSPKSLWYDNTDFGFLGINVYKDRLELNYKDQKGKVLYSVTVNNNK